ncbi:MAG: protein of unknown function (DUF4160) [Candidatus Electronema aureum]|uniref:DUF4160 domain-containing protein n=1 Tax=Candidatus Electronema aureum TaxID=2005002 RepID=A0A521G534_9BACT|nr:MAG: protein of unknown function (DUF4160) [Candidatus Electronema aureum]
MCETGDTLPTISMFYGIIVRMYFAPNEHPPPHFHVYYAEYKAIHQDELMADWNLMMNGEEPFKIQPLQ